MGMKRIKWLIFQLMYSRELEEMHNMRSIAVDDIENPRVVKQLEYYLGMKSGVERTLYLLSGKLY